MGKIGLFYGSNTGNTEAVAYQIAEKFNQGAAGLVDVHNIGGSSPEDILKYDYIVLGIPTWNTGELQDDWAFFLPKMEGMNFSGKKVALFGLGDQNGYGFNFLDAMGILADEVMIQGGTVFGFTSTASYQYEESLADEENGDAFMGLGIDQEGQADLTDTRIEKWVNQVKTEFGV